MKTKFGTTVLRFSNFYRTITFELVLNLTLVIEIVLEEGSYPKTTIDNLWRAT